LLLVAAEAEVVTPALQVLQVVGSKLLPVVPGKVAAEAVALRFLEVALVFLMVVVQALLEHSARVELAEPVGMPAEAEEEAVGTVAVAVVPMTMTAVQMEVAVEADLPMRTLLLRRTFPMRLESTQAMAVSRFTTRLSLLSLHSAEPRLPQFRQLSHWW
jgi:hypothetical protein